MALTASERQARYRRTAKGKAAEARYRRGAARKNTLARYRATDLSRQTAAIVNARRIFVNGVYRGSVKSVAIAAAIRKLVKERTYEFISRFKTGAEVKGVTAGAVPPQAVTRADRLGGGHVAPGDRSPQER